MSDLRARPAEVAPDLMVAALAFYVAGGGFDGDGGIPDSDIALLGIDAHRSIFTHSIVAGAVVETALYSLVDFIAIAYRHLPENHDRRWTIIHERAVRAADSGAQGMSLGLAYHLGVDGLVQPGAYHDLPIELSLQSHQVILTTNAVAEGVDSASKKPEAQRERKMQAQTTPAAAKEAGASASIMTGALTLAALLLGFS